METERRPADDRELLVQRLVSSKGPMTAGIAARDRRTGETLVSYDPDQPLPPASNLKLVTAAVALDRLGPDHRFETTVTAVGDHKENRLVGDLVLTGVGAPDLSQSDLMTLAEGVREAGIEQVSGSLVLDASAFKRQSLGPGWTWDDEQFAYGAKSTPIALERNTVEITVVSDDRETTVDVSPSSRLVRLNADVEVIDDQEPSIEVYKNRASDVIQVSGHVPPDTTHVEASPIDDPMMHCGHVFRDALSSVGVSVEGWITIAHEATEDGEQCAVITSDPVSTLVQKMSIHTDNFIAEQLARSVARETFGTGSWKGWTEIASAFLEERSIEPACVRDGSGMSRYNLLSASGILSTLEWALDQPWSETYRRSIPIAGEEGTMTNRLSDLPVTVRAKTGTVTGTRSLSGYVEVGDEPVVTFACILSNLTNDIESNANDVLDELVHRIVDTAGFLP